MTTVRPTDPPEAGPGPEPRVAPEPDYGFPTALWRALARIPVPPPPDPTHLAQPAARPLADLGVRHGPARRHADRDRHRPALLPRLRPAVRPGHPRRRRATSSCRTSTGRPTRRGSTGSPRACTSTLGMVLTPVVLAKLWSVVPKLFAWPPVISSRHLLERLSLLALVGGILFEFVTGLMNAQYDYSFGFSFYLAHYYGAWVFIAGFVSHVVIKLPTMVRSLRAGRRTGASAAGSTTPSPRREPEPPDDHGLVAARAEPADAEPSRPARRRSAAAACWSAVSQRRHDLGPPAPAGAARPRAGSPTARARTTSRSTARLFGLGHRPGAARRGLAPALRGGATEAVAHPRPAARHGAAHRHAADRLRRGAGRSTGRGPGSGCATSPPSRACPTRPMPSCSRSRPPAPTPARRCRQPGRSTRTRCSRCASATRARRPSTCRRPRLPGPGDRPGAARRAQHQVGLRRSTSAGAADGVVPAVLAPLLRRAPAAPALGARVLRPLRVRGVATCTPTRAPSWLAVWFLGAVIAHDLVLYPLYALADRR